MDFFVPAQVMDIFVPAQVLDVFVPAQVIDIFVPAQVLDIFVPAQVLDIFVPAQVTVSSPLKLLNTSHTICPLLLREIFRLRSSCWTQVTRFDRHLSG